MFTGADFAHFTFFNTIGKFHTVTVAVAAYFNFEPFGEGVDHRNADAVETAGNFIRIAVKFSTGVQNGVDHFQSRLVSAFFHADGNTAAVIFDGTTAVAVDGYFDLGAVAGHGLVDGVIHHFTNQVMQTSDLSVTNVHFRTLADGVHPFQDGDFIGTVISRCLVNRVRLVSLFFYFFHLFHFIC